MSMSQTVSTPIRTDHAPFTADQTTEIVADFRRDGYRLLPAVLAPEEVEALKRAMDRVFEEPRWRETNNVYGDFVAVRLFEVDPVFEDMLTREPIISLAESILGANCHLIAQNGVRNRPGEAIDRFHVDEFLMLPVGEGMERHDSRLEMPIYLLAFQILLTDVPSVEYGPTQFVPGSHYAGRNPNDPYAPEFEGRRAESVLARAGDVYLHNGQCWHRGAPNISDRTRYLLQAAYGMRWISQRFYPFVNYQIPPYVLDRADERRRRVLGFHSKGPYG